MGIIVFIMVLVWVCGVVGMGTLADRYVRSDVLAAVVEGTFTIGGAAGITAVLTVVGW